MKIGVIGTGQFAGSFIGLWQRHPDVGDIHVTDLVPERAAEHVERYGIAGAYDDADALIASDVDAVAVFTQRWTHAELVLKALDAGKHVYSAVPMALQVDEIEAIVRKVEETGLVYMMGETSYYNPAVVWAREQNAKRAFGRVFYSEGDYVHDMDNGFYAAYQFSGGEGWKATASYRPCSTRPTPSAACSAPCPRTRRRCPASGSRTTAATGCSTPTCRCGATSSAT